MENLYTRDLKPLGAVLTSSLIVDAKLSKGPPSPLEGATTQYPNALRCTADHIHPQAGILKLLQHSPASCRYRRVPSLVQQ